MKKIKILHVHTVPVISGTGINTLLTMRGLNRNKYEVEFTCVPGEALIDKVRVGTNSLDKAWERIIFRIRKFSI